MRTHAVVRLARHPRSGPPRRSTVIAMLAVCLSPLFVGCGRAEPLVAEPERAGEILAVVLAAWRDGATCEAMRGRSPPIHVADERWLRGDVLESFQIGPPRSFGPSTRFDVTLAGPPPLGRRKVVYAVSTRPTISVSPVD